MSDCGCDDGIGLYVCEKHSTPENDLFHYIFHANKKNKVDPLQEETEEDEEYD